MRSTSLDNIGKRNYSTSEKDQKFFEWLSGISDAEGSFVIGSRKGRNSFSFSFVIALHVDDTEMLQFIQKSLGIGKVYTFGKKSRGRWVH